MDASEVSIAGIAKRARAGSRQLAKLSNERRNEMLLAAAKAIEGGAQSILDSNERDCRVAESLVGSGKMSAAMSARLRVTSKSIEEMAERVRDVARVPDPLGRKRATTELDDNLVLYKETCPLGVVGIVFESRPDVVPQVGSLAIKTGNGLVLKGGAEARHTNRVLVSIWHDALGAAERPVDVASLCRGR